MSEVDTSAEAVEAAIDTLLGWLTGPDSGQNDGITDTVALLRALAAERDALEETMAREAENACAVVAAEVAARVTAEAERDAARAEAQRMREAHGDLDAWATAEVARLKRLWTYMQEAAADTEADEPLTAASWLAEFEDAEQRTRAALEGRADG